MYLAPLKEIRSKQGLPSPAVFTLSVLLIGTLLTPVGLLHAQDFSSQAYTLQSTAANARETVAAEPVNAPVFGGAARVSNAERESASGRVRAASTTSTSTVSSDSKSVPKDVVKLATISRPIFTISAGYQTTYNYHGLDVIGANSSVGNLERTVDPFYAVSNFLPPGRITSVVNGVTHDKLNSDVFFLTGAVEWQGFRLSVGYTQALQSTVPYKTTLAFIEDGLTNQTPYNLYFRGNATPPALKDDYYKEVTIGLNYTLALTTGLSATIGYNNFIIPNESFRNTTYLGEALLRFTYAPPFLPYVKASLTYYRYFSDARVPQLQSNVLDLFFVTTANGPGQAANQSTTVSRGPQYLNGGYADLRIDGDIPIAKSGRFSLRFQPYILVSYNNGFFTRLTTASPVASGPYIDNNNVLQHFVANNGTKRNEFNTFEVGGQLRFAYGGFSVTPSVNYGVDLSKNGDGNSFSDNGNTGKQKNVWGGVTVAFTF